MHKVLWLTNIPSPYRVDFFNQLGKDCDLTVLFEKAFSNERDGEWKNYKFNNFKGIILKNISVDVDKSFSLESLKFIRKFKSDIIVVSNPITPVGIVSILYMRMFGIPYAVESDGAFPKASVGFKGKLKKILYKGAKACFTTSETGRLYFEEYGVKSSVIFKYPFTSIKQSYFPGIPTNEEKTRMKQILGVKGNKMVVTVGQFIHRKGYDILLKAVEKLNDNSIDYYFIGGEPTGEYLDYCKKYNLSNVHFLKFMKSEDLKKWYMAADLFVLPTREDIWGLVINEAMACGLPVITTNRCVAGLEMINGQNGAIVAIEDVDGLATEINNLIYSKDLPLMGRAAQLSASHYTIESMSERHIELFNSIYK